MTKIALAQVTAEGRGSPAAALETASLMTEEAAAAGASLICFPEQFVTGWSPEISPESGEPLDGPLTAAFGRMAQESGIAVVGSIVEAGQGRRPKNTAVVLDADGEIIAAYAKIHLFSPDGEDCNYTAGDRIATFTVDGTTFGLAVCYDLRFPEVFRIYALAGAECVLVPAAWPCLRIRHWETLLPARALENRFYVAGVNTAGGSGGVYCGWSLAADPDGEVIAKGGSGEEVIFVDLDPAAVHEAQRRLPSLSDRRSDLYHRLLSNL